MLDATPFLPGLSPVARKSLTATQDAGNLTSKGGLVVLREAARRLGLAGVVADPLPDTRNQLLVIHSYRAMVTARMMAIAAGYEDADDLDALRHDPALLIACERAPESGHDIPSQPTISRLENLADARTLYKIGTGFIDLFCRSYATAPATIVLDIDMLEACSPSARHQRHGASWRSHAAHGRQQELALFNTHAGGHCFQPIHIFEAGSGKPILSLIRPGKRPSGEEIARVLGHVLHRIRRHEKVYCQRGTAENLIKDMKLATRSDKTACSRWQANQFRLFLHTGAYWLLHSLRMAAPKKSRWRRATFETIRTTFVKIGCRVEELKRQVKLVFPRHVPHAAALALITHRLTAQGP